MVNKNDIEVVLNDIIKNYTIKCAKNQIPSNDLSFGVRLTKDVRDKFDEFTEQYCGDNPSDVEHLWVMGDSGSTNLTKTGQIDSVTLNKDELSFLSEFKDNSLHQIHNHPKSGGFRDKMPECLSSEDILECISNDWSKSITAVSSVNGSKMILMKNKDFVHDFEVEADAVANSYRLTDAYFKYMSDWESETRKVWDDDEKNGGVIAKEVMNNPSGTGGIVGQIHSKYEEIAKSNIGKFEERLGDIRKRFNRIGLELSIEE